jgi:Leucine-rich repeat (LRR) protein
MESSRNFFLVLIISAFATAKGQTIQLNCRFSLVGTNYICILQDITVPDNQNAAISVGGVHQSGRGNNDVNQIMLTNSNIRFVITQLFSTFPNVEYFLINNGGLTRIQPNAFTNSRKLNQIVINRNPNLRIIEENSYAGLAQVQTLEVFSNGIEAIHPSAFSGLSSLSKLSLHQNKIRQLPANIFSSLSLLASIRLEDNLLTSLDGQVFVNNPRLTSINFQNNQINAIGRDFLDNLKSLISINFSQNICVDKTWKIEGLVTIETVHADLENCFANSAKPENEIRRFMLEVRGPLTLRFENGTQIVEV